MFMTLIIALLNHANGPSSTATTEQNFLDALHDVNTLTDEYNPGAFYTFAVADRIAQLVSGCMQADNAFKTTCILLTVISYAHRVNAGTTTAVQSGAMLDCISHIQAECQPLSPIA
jgi:hypothetical protein